VHAQTLTEDADAIGSVHRGHARAAHLGFSADPPPARARHRARLAPLRAIEWVVYAKRPFAGPAVLAYLSRYTHRVAISNSRLIGFDERGVTFRWKDYRAKGRTRYKTMTVATGEFIRRFLLHVLPSGFHRMRHYGLLANASRKDNLAVARQLLQAPPAPPEPPAASAPPTFVCRHCGAAMIVIEILARVARIRAPPVPPGTP
jgi:hypothetical protein